MNFEYKNDKNKIAIITFFNKSEYCEDIRNNHLLYCKANNYNYFIIEDEISNEELVFLIKKHDYIMFLSTECIVTNKNIKIEDLISEDKYFHLNNYEESEIVLFKSYEQVFKIIVNVLHDKKFDFEAFSENYKNVIHFYDDNQICCDYKNYTTDKFMLSLDNIHSKIDIKKQIQLFNNLLETEDEEPKIIVSVATIPSRIKGLLKLVENLLSGNIPPDKIIFSLPSKYKLFPDSETHIEKINNLLLEYIKKDIVYINEFKVDNENIYDYGPCNKWLGVYKFLEDNPEYNQNNFVAIVLDDDVLYNLDYFEILMDKHKLYNRDVITGYTSYSNYGKNLTVNIREFKTRSPLLKGVNGNLLPKHFFCNILNPSFKTIIDYGIKSMDNDIVFHDDPIITTLVYYYKYYVKSVNNEIKARGKACSYYHNKTNDDRKIDFHGVSSLKKSKKVWFDVKQVTRFLDNFKNYYKY